MTRLSTWLLRLALRFRRWVLDRQLAAHVPVCAGRKPYGYGKCTTDLENCDENQFCKVGKQLFSESFDLTFRLAEVK